MGKVTELRNDGSLRGVMTQLHGMIARDEVKKMIVIIVPEDGDIPTIAFCQTDSPVEELGLLEIAKIQALKTRNIIIGE